MQQQMIISVVSKDRPGIIADITGAIFDLDGDLADLSQSILCGYLTMTLIATFAADRSPTDVISKINELPAGKDYDVMVKPMDIPLKNGHGTLPEKTYIVTAQGKNKSGMVYNISSFCYQRNINIMDLSTTLEGGLYTMILQIDLSHVDSIIELRGELSRHAEENGMNIMMQHYDIFRVTNEVTLI